MTKTALIAAFALFAVGCAPTSGAVPPPRAGEAGKSRPDPSDTCGAKALQYLVGRPKTEIPVPVDVKSRRVTCTTCPVTLDFSPVRVNIFFDQATGIVKEVKCG